LPRFQAACRRRQEKGTTAGWKYAAPSFVLFSAQAPGW
jgi:hypothetical protein